MPLTSMVAALLPQLPIKARVLLLATIEAEAFPLPAGPAARLLGFARRQSLYTALRTAGLPPWGTLRRWLLLLDRVLEWEEAHHSMSAQALGEERNPSAYYRGVARVTGHQWTEVRLRGSTWVLAELARVLSVDPPFVVRSTARIRGRG